MLRIGKSKDANAERPTRDRMAWLAFLLALVSLTGFYNLWADAWGPLFRLNLILHPLIGIAVTIPLLRGVMKQLQVRIPGLRVSVAVAGATVLGLAVTRAITFEFAEIANSNKIAGLVAFSIAIVGTYFGFRFLPLIKTAQKNLQTWLLAALATLWFLQTVAGVLIVLLGGGRDNLVFFEGHSFVGYFAAAAGVFALWPFGSASRMRSFLSGTAKATLLCVACWLVSEASGLFDGREGRMQSTTFNLAALATDRRESDFIDPKPHPVDAKYLDIANSCGTSACHEEILQEHNRSPHTLAYQQPHQKKILDLLAEELGEDERDMCAGCHVPSSLTRGGKPTETFYSQDNIGCVFCHVMTSREELAPNRGRVSIELNTMHLAPFADAEASGGALDPLTFWAIQLNPEAHGRVFRRDFHGSDEHCLSCHFVELEPISDEPSCLDCHMPAQPDGTPLGFRRAHFFVGANAGMYRMLGMEDDFQRTQDWMNSDTLIRELRQIYQPDEIGVPVFGDARHNQFFYLQMSSRFVTAPTPGATSTLEITTNNVGMTHAFPASSWDLLEVWLEVEITDRDGQVVYRAPTLNADGSLHADAHKITGAIIGSDGKPIEHYRVWDAQKVIPGEQIPPYGSRTDRFEVALPSTPAEQYNIDARWMVREMSHKFFRWAYPHIDEIPAAVVAKHSTTFAAQ